jgi:hypothetical protein
MKVLALILSMVVMTAVLILGSTLILLTAPHRPGALIALAVAPLSFFAYGPILVGSLKTYYDTQRSADGKRYFARWFWIIVGVEALAVVAIAVYAVLAPAPLWLPIVFVVVGAILMVLAFVVGNALRRRDEAREPADVPWQPIDRRVIQRKILIVAVTFVVALVVVSVLVGIAEAGGRHPDRAIGETLSFGFEFGFIAAAFACALVTLSIARALRASLNRDLGRARKFARLILRGKNVELTSDEQVPAARYASLISINLSFTLGFLLLLYVGLFIQEVQQLTNGGSQGFVLGYMVGLVVVLVVLFPMQIVRIRRAQRYARDHDELLKRSELQGESTSLPAIDPA